MKVRASNLAGFLLASPRLSLMLLVQGYRLFLRPLLGNRCRYWPTCSEYALEALHKHGAVQGSAMGVYRVLRCHPFCAGGHDPVPEHALFTLFKSRTKISP